MFLVTYNLIRFKQQKERAKFFQYLNTNKTLVFLSEFSR